jgi:hypothetical protein
MSSLPGEYSALSGAPLYHTFRAGSFMAFVLLCSLIKLDSLVRYADEEAT